MAFFNWSKYLRRKARQARAQFKFKEKKKDDVVDWGNGKSYKFDGKRWKKVEEAEELELDVSEDHDSDTDSDSEVKLASSKAVKTLSSDVDTKLDLKANKNMDNVGSLPASVVATLKGDVGATFTMSGTTLNITT